jgi:hypothetical protein
MFGFLRPKLAPEGPIEIRCETTVECTAVDLYRLADWADPHNGRRQLGSEIIRLDDPPGRYRVGFDELPEHFVEVSVTEEVRHASYAFTCEIVPRIGRMVRTHERYGFDPLTPASCRLSLVVTATVAGPLRVKEHEHEVATMTLASRNALAKLKLHAEDGVEAARAVQGQLIV